jgi:virginiamycin B lyase
MISATWIVLKSNARSLMWRLVGVAFCAFAAGCSLFGGSHSAAVPPPPAHQRVQQLKTPANPPIPVALATMFPMPETFDPNEYLPGVRMGSDQNVWMSVYDSNQIARYNTLGLVSAWVFPQDPQCLLGPPVCSAGPTDMVLGPDGNMYVSLAQLNAIAQVTPLGVITVYPLDPNVFPLIAPQDEGPRGIAIGPDNDIWFIHSTASKIGRMTLSGNVINAYPTPTANSGGGRITAGPDGNMWFTEGAVNNIGRLDIATGRITEFPTPTAGSYPHTIVWADDGNLWFTEKLANQLGRITPSGVITEFTTPSQVTHPTYMYSGPDGSLWFAENFNSAICRVDPVQETFVEYTTYPSVLIQPTALTTGANGDVWVTDINNDTLDAFTPNGGPPLRPLSRVRHRSTMLPTSRSRT